MFLSSVVKTPKTTLEKQPVFYTKKHLFVSKKYQKHHVQTPLNTCLHPKHLFELAFLISNTHLYYRR